MVDMNAAHVLLKYYLTARQFSWLGGLVDMDALDCKKLLFVHRLPKLLK